VFPLWKGGMKVSTHSTETLKQTNIPVGELNGGAKSSDQRPVALCSAQAAGAVVVFFRDGGISVVQQGAPKMEIVSSMNGGRRCPGTPK
jgi:hypothetical protein